MAYLMRNFCSTRVRPDVKCEDFIDYEPGQIVESFPAHVPVDEWLEKGHIELIQEKHSRAAKEKLTTTEDVGDGEE